MRSEGQKIFKSGLVTKIKGKKIDDIYHIYGCVTNSSKSSEQNTHIKIDLSKGVLAGVKCTCEEFKELSTSGYLFMCSHLTATAYKFFSLTSKNNSEENQKPKSPIENNKIKLVRKVSRVQHIMKHNME